MATKTFADKDRPWVSNYPPLKLWLDALDARCEWQIPYGNTGHRNLGEVIPEAYIECWSVKGRTIVIMVRARQRGWEVWSTIDSPRIDETLEHATRQLGLSQTDAAILVATVMKQADGKAVAS